MTGRCRDLHVPAGAAIATGEGYVALTRESARRLAINGMLLAYSPEHRERLRQEALAASVKRSGSAARP